MKNKHWVGAFTVLFVFTTCILGKPFIVQAQIKLEIDKTNASLVFESLKKGQADDLSYVANLQGTKILVEHAIQFDKNASMSAYQNELEAAIRSKDSVSNGSFRFGSIKRNLSKVEFLYQYISEHSKELNDYLSMELARYYPLKEELNIKVFLLLGGTSDGFSDGKTFCLDLGFFQDDVEAMKLLMLHEMFHIVQESLLPTGTFKLTNARDSARFELLKGLFDEGSASYLANPLTINNPREYTRWFQGKYRTNFKRMDEDFELFKSIFYRIEFDANAKFDDLYNLGFSDKWGSPFYFVGFRMCELIKKYEGDNFLNSYLQKSPTTFLLQYAKYAALEKKPEVYPLFGDDLVKIVRRFEQRLLKARR